MEYIAWLVLIPAAAHLLFGGWTCPHCGTRMDKWGRSEGSEISVSRSRPL
jgi:hypothetical protein